MKKEKDNHEQVMQHLFKLTGLKEIKDILSKKPDIIDSFGEDRDFPSTMLTYACYLGKEEAALFFLEKGADPNKTPAFARPPLLTSLLATPKNMTIIQALIKAGADINYIDYSYGNAQSMLQLASYYQDTEAMKILLDLGADMDEVVANNPLGRTAMEVASNQGKQISMDFLKAYKEAKELRGEIGIKENELENTSPKERNLKI